MNIPGDELRRTARRTENSFPQHGWKVRRSQLARYFGMSLLLHFGWEMAQMPLFELRVGTVWESVWLCLYAAATGDLLFMAVIYVMVGVAHRDPWWIVGRAAYRHPATWIQPVVLGVLLAVSFELWAIYVDRRWSYGAMPLVPLLRVGWTPVLQMIIVPVVTVCYCRRRAIG